MSPSPFRPAAFGAAAAHWGGWIPGFVMGALVFALGAGGAVLIWGGSTVDGGLGDRLTALEDRLADLEQQPGSEATSLEGLASAQDLERLSQGLTDLQARVTGTPAEVEDLATRLCRPGSPARRRRSRIWRRGSVAWNRGWTRWARAPRPAPRRQPPWAG
jgi:hypothetical protein